MDSLVEYVALYANILVRSKELDELRERLGELRERLEKAKSSKTRCRLHSDASPPAFTDGLSHLRSTNAKFANRLSRLASLR